MNPAFPAEWLAFSGALSAAIAEATAMPRLTVGATSREAAWQSSGVTLWRYGPAPRSRSAVPVLIVYSLVNRPYLLDLSPDRSLIAALLARGRSVYLLDWGEPGEADRERSLADYIMRLLGGAVAECARLCGRTDVDLLGVCQGGTFALCHAALEPGTVRRLVTMVTPVDFATPDDVLGAYARALDTDGFIAHSGNVPGALLRLGFQSLKAYANSLGKLVALAEAANDRPRLELLLRTERWIADCPDQAGRAFAEFIEFFYRNNALISGRLVLADRPVRPAAIVSPVLNIYASRDHLVPPAAARALASLVPQARYEEHAFAGGHIGTFLSRRAQSEVPDAIQRFLSARR